MMENKFRHELKYICSNGELQILKVRLNSVMKLDPYVNEQGTYHIRSIYFDDWYDSCMRENEAGINHRQKWRIRAYNNNDQIIFLECKKKENNMILKKSVKITKQQFKKLICKEPLKVSDKNSPLLNQFIFLTNNKGYRPKVIVGYDRQPYICKNGNVRVTIDTHIYSSTEIKSFFCNEIKKRPIQTTGQHLLEVKYDEYIPDYIFRTVQMNSMQKGSFSKYYLCRKYIIQ